MITRLIKLGTAYHAIVQDHQGHVHHQKFISKERAIEYIEGYYHDHRRIVSYEL
jgi:hypothetical protein